MALRDAENIVVGILVAKDKEWNQIMAVFKKYRIPSTQHQVDSVSATVFIWENVKCAISYMNTMGQLPAKAFTKKFLDAYGPRYLTTVGFCGGLTADIGKVLICEEGYLQNPDKSFTMLKCRVHDYGRVEVCRLLSNELGAKLVSDLAKRPRKMFTSADTNPTKGKDAVQTLLRALNVDADGLDMEICAIWFAAHEWDPLERAVKTIPAVKGVSDGGMDEDREKFGPQVIQDAFFILLEMIKCMNKNGHLAA